MAYGPPLLTHDQFYTAETGCTTWRPIANPNHRTALHAWTKHLWLLRLPCCIYAGHQVCHRPPRCWGGIRGDPRIGTSHPLQAGRTWSQSRSTAPRMGGTDRDLGRHAPPQTLACARTITVHVPAPTTLHSCQARTSRALGWLISPPHFVRGRRGRPLSQPPFVRVGVRRSGLQSVISCHLTFQTPTTVTFPQSHQTSASIASPHKLLQVGHLASLDTTSPFMGGGSEVS